MFIHEILTPSFITGLVQNYPMPELLGKQIFGEPEKHPVTFIQTDEEDNSRQLVYHTGAGGKSKALTKIVGSRRTHQMARLYDHIMIMMSELINLRMIGENGLVLADKATLTRWLMKHTRQMVERHEATKEQIRWSFLMTGAATFYYDASNTTEVDYGFEVAQIADAAATWATASSDHAADLDVMKAWFHRRAPGAKITANCGQNTQRYLINSTSIKHGAATRIREQINDKGEITFFYDIFWKNYFAQYQNYSGTWTSYLTDDIIVFTADTPGSFTSVVGPAEAEALQAIDPSFQIESKGVGVTSYIETIKDPPAIKQIVEERYLPVILRNHAVYVLDTTP